MNQVELAKARFGGTRKLARATGIPVSTVDSWFEFIPSHRMAGLLEVAAREGIALTRDELDAASAQSVTDRNARLAERRQGVA